MPPKTGFSVEKLTSAHAVEDFECGSKELDRFLARYALVNQRADSSATYVGLSDKSIIGFYTLTVGKVNYDDAPDRLTKGLAHYPIPIMLLARLAVSKNRQNQGIGSGLLKDAMRRTIQAADIVGIRAIAAHAKDDQARQFYEHFDFISSPTDPYHLLLLLKDVRSAIVRIHP
ncbi:GNAT family N-acetyltransferase [Chlorobium ferrooxidans]|uniref:GCN5-related N-acetyltransferase n=1 Tax=Chlorobium ferrooxidans DSM 13031 TaxID=377431 RepID=Q0YTC1_9CHLB|nr:GNAT family N-acetyltransferase [Chlorobium ferrooxidans]EAT59627.1 GCN5-related N-acetyltransferase [Chlorobium ferrooxidans DSM 13031]